MHYVISDIHGCKNEYLALLEKIKFNEEDHLYILGDVVDRGPDSVGVLLDIMKRDNVTFLLGNHDLLLYYFINKLGYSLSDIKCDEDERDFYLWLKDGGLTTMEGYLGLSYEDRNAVFDFIRKARPYEILEMENKKYVMSHAGIADFQEEKSLEMYGIMNFISTRMDYSKRYFSDENTYIISGHTPTPLIRNDRRAEIYIGAGHIATDCGCVFGGRLAAYCIETGKTEYVACQRKR